MSEKRKDNKGRILRSGESQRSNGTYQFRYTDRYGSRQYVYAATLDELRSKEADVLSKVHDGVGGPLENVTVEELINFYINRKKRLKPTTVRNYKGQLRTIQRYPLSKMIVGTVRRSDVIRMCEDMADDGLSFSSINVMKTLLIASFQSAVDDDAIRKNPAVFRLSEYLENETEDVRALTQKEVDSFLEFISKSKCYGRYYDLIVAMLETGLRAGEMCGLTIDDVDFANRRVHVSKQLMRIDGRLYVGSPKTSSSVREIPMTERAIIAFSRLIAARGQCQTEHIVNGYSGFLLVSRSGKPKFGNELTMLVKRMADAYNKANHTNLHITPHVMRHTFCTMLSNKKVSPKSIQYLMGHSSLDMQRIYDDPQYDVVREEILSLEKTS